MTRRRVDFALELAAEGYKVFPVEDGGKAPELCLAPSWPQDSTDSRERIAEWASVLPETNWGVDLGGSGLFVVDLDTSEAVEDFRAELAAHGHEWVLDDPETAPGWVVRTGKGYHVYYLQPVDFVVRSKPKGKCGLGEHVELKGDGGYVVAPGSIHPSGAVYESVARDMLADDAPEWLLEKLGRIFAPEDSPPALPDALETPAPAPRAAEGAGEAELERALETIRAAAEGTRRDTVRDVSTRLFRISLSGGNTLKPETVYEALYAAGLDIGLEVGELGRVLRDQRDFAMREGAVHLEPRPKRFGSHVPELEGEPPAPADVLDRVRERLAEYVTVTDAALDVLAVWVAHTHALDAFDFSPLLHIHSALPASGKSRLLEVLELLVPRPMSSGNATAAVLYRVVSESVLLLDELDTMLAGADSERREAIANVLNLGFQRGKVAQRCTTEGGRQVVEEFQLFGAKAAASIRRTILPASTLSRSVPVEMRRRLKHERPPARFRHRHVAPILGQLHAELAAAFGSSSAVSELRGLEVPEEQLAHLTDRQADITEPLYAVAQLAGAGWVERVDEALRELFGGDADIASTEERLLEDIRTIFDDLTADELPLGALVQRLLEDDASEWTDANNGRPITPQWVGQRLKPFGIRAVKLRRNGGQTRFLLRSELETVWERNLPAPAPELATAEPTQPATSTTREELP